MRYFLSIFQTVSVMFVVGLVAGCGGGSSDSDDSQNTTTTSGATFKGMPLYANELQTGQYQLTAMTDTAFYQLSEARQRWVADKLLATLYFGLPNKALSERIQSGAFISGLLAELSDTQNDVAAAEARLEDSGSEGDEEFNFSDSPSGTEEISKMLARFYVLPKLDKHYFENWAAYVLSSNIMFSPAYELASSHPPNIERVYASLVRSLKDDYSIQYTTYNHMISDDNWRRFRSPEDNGREMMEIFLFDFDDNHVPIAGQALKNWRLDRDHDTLVIGLNENTEPLSLFGQTLYNGHDFYSGLVRSSDFIPGVTRRLVDVYFPTFSEAEKNSVVNQIVASNPASWADILKQIVFSNTYLLQSDKPKSAEEVFYSLAKKMSFEHRRGFFSNFARSLTTMNQASMKYKLGNFLEVPLDTQSFSTYHKFVRENLLIRYRSTWSSGWVDEALLANDVFADIAAYEHTLMLETLVKHLFLTTVARLPSEAELTLFKNHMIQADEDLYVSGFRLFRDDGQLDDRRNAAITILDYASRLSDTYRFRKVQ